MSAEAVADQAQGQSVEERIASRFGAQAPPVPEAENEAEAAEFAEIEWEGVKYQIPPALKGGFLKNEDYTRKTQELADQRRSYEQLSEVARTASVEKAFIDSTAQEREALAVINAYLQQINTADWASMTTDQALRQKMEIDNIKERKAALMESLGEKRSQFDTTMKARIEELRGKSWEAASKSIQGYSEQTKAELREFAKVEGLTEAEFDNVSADPRSIRIIYKAMQYDKVKSAAKEPVQTKSGILKVGPGSERMPADVVNKLNYRKAMDKAKTTKERNSLVEERLMSIFAK